MVSNFAEATTELGARTRRPSPELRDFGEAALSGLSRRPRAIPCRFLYDARGFNLFEQITRLPEYYLTRTETALLVTFGEEIASLAGPKRVVVEFGAGSARKTGGLLRALKAPRAYVPIEICRTALADSVRRLKAGNGRLDIIPVVGDFTKISVLPETVPPGPRFGFFSGSTIGNLTHREAKTFLSRAARLLGSESLFLVGVDLKKDLRILLPAYDDAQGVTAAFTLNLLARINRELAGNFVLSRFAHEARYNEILGRIEIHIVSLANQNVWVLGHRFRLKQGERIHAENSHKYTVEEFQALARASGWTPIHAWTDKAQLFSLHLLRA